MLTESNNGFQQFSYKRLHRNKCKYVIHGDVLFFRQYLGPPFLTHWLTGTMLCTKLERDVK